MSYWKMIWLTRTMAAGRMMINVAGSFEKLGLGRNLRSLCGRYVLVIQLLKSGGSLVELLPNEFTKIFIREFLMKQSDRGQCIFQISLQLNKLVLQAYAFSNTMREISIIQTIRNVRSTDRMWYTAYGTIYT